MLEKLQYDVDNEKSYSQMKTEIEDILSITDENSFLYICHPRHAFRTLEEDKETKLITDVDWNSLDMELVTKFDDYGKFSILDQYFHSNKNQFTYLRKRFSKMLKSYFENGNEQFVYPLAVIEEKRDKLTNKSSYTPRGIICARQGGIMVCSREKAKKANVYLKKATYH